MNGLSVAVSGFELVIMNEFKYHQFTPKEARKFINEIEQAIQTLEQEETNEERN